MPRWYPIGTVALALGMCTALTAAFPTNVAHGRQLSPGADSHGHPRGHHAKAGSHAGPPETSPTVHGEAASHAGATQGAHGAQPVHGDGDDVHGADGHADDGHGGDGHGGDGHGDGEHGSHGHVDIDDEMALLLMLALIMLSLIFEESKHHIEKRADEHKQIILQQLFGELTVLGFIALITFFLMDSGVFTRLSMRIYNDPDHLLHLFEKVHFGLFFVMVFFLLIVSWLIIIQNSAAREWLKLDELGMKYLQEQRQKRRDAERRRAERQAASSGGVNGRQGDGGDLSPPALPLPSDDYLRSRYGDGGAIPVGLGRDGAGPYTRMDDGDPGDALEMDDFQEDYKLRRRSPKLFRFLQMRERFIAGLKGGEGRKVKLANPDDFRLGAYFRACSGSITAHVVHIHPVTWFIVALSLAAVYICNAFLSHTATCVVLVLWGWVNVGLLVWAKMALDGVTERLLPPPTASLAQIRESDEDALPPYILEKRIVQGVTKHDQLWPFGVGEGGPDFFTHLIRTVMLTCAVYVIGIMEIFAKEMLAEPGLIGVTMVAASNVSVVASLFLLRPLLAPLVVAQKIGMRKDHAVIERVYREQQINTSIHLLEVLRSMQAKAAQFRRLAMRTESTATAGDLQASQEKARAYFVRHPRQRQFLVEAFQSYDRNHSGTIEAGEMQDLLKSLGLDMSEAQVQQLLCVARRCSRPRPSGLRALTLPCRAPVLRPKGLHGPRWLHRVGFSG